MDDFDLSDYALQWNTFDEIMASPQYREYRTFLSRYGLVQQYEQVCRDTIKAWRQGSEQYEFLSNCIRSLMDIGSDLSTALLRSDIRREWQLLRRYASEGSATVEQYEAYKLLNTEIELQTQLALRSHIGRPFDEILLEVRKLVIIHSDGSISMKEGVQVWHN